MRDAAADRAFVPDRRVRDVRRGLVKERRVPGDQRISQHLAMPGERADTQPIPLQFDAAKCRDMCNVDQQLRRLQTQGQRRHQDSGHQQCSSHLRSNPRMLRAPPSRWRAVRS